MSDFDALLYTCTESTLKWAVKCYAFNTVSGIPADQSYAVATTASLNDYADWVKADKDARVKNTSYITVPAKMGKDSEDSFDMVLFTDKKLMMSFGNFARDNDFPVATLGVSVTPAGLSIAKYDPKK